MSYIQSFLTRNEESIRRTLMMIALFAIPVCEALTPAIILDADLWWHLRAGQWVVEHGAVPTTDPFSSYGMGKPWVAYSWLFEVLIYDLYRLFGLIGPVIYTVALWLAIAFALFTLIRKLEPNFVMVIVLTAAGIVAIGPFTTPRPWLFTILFFIIEINLLWTVRRSSNFRQLLFLPPLFAIWANIHIQFIYGLFVLGLWAVEPLLCRLLRRFCAFTEVEAIPARRSWFIVAACVAATLINPYHVKVYQVAFGLIGDAGPFQYISELQALNFRRLPDWFVLITTLGAAFALARWREVRPLSILLLSAGIFLSFRASRDAWFVVIVAVTIIAASRSLATKDEARYVVTKTQALFVIAAIGILLFLTSRVQNISESKLQEAVAEAYPAAAATIVEERGYLGPLYNHFNWGGYLIWRLPRLPVSMDGRINVHGNKRTERSMATWKGKRDWATDPELTPAHLVIAEVDEPLSSLLRLDPRFELVYEDKVAAVFIAHESAR